VGNVITVEPGIYIPEESLGIRIEDDILVTETGNTNLSKGIPKEIEELESIRQEALK
jgi:Xaa-Pro aminopeptidase